MIGAQSQRRDSVAVGHAATLAGAHEHVIELCESPRRVLATCVPPPTLASCEGCEPAGRLAEPSVGRHHVLPRQEVVQRSGIAVLSRRHKQRSLGPGGNGIQVSEDHYCVALRHLLHLRREVLEETSSFLLVGSSGRIRAEQASVPAAKPDVNTKQPVRQGKTAAALLQPWPNQHSYPSTSPLIH